MPSCLPGLWSNTPLLVAAFAALVVASGCDVDATTWTDVVGCDGQVYTKPSASPYVLPYPVRAAHPMNLGNCAGSAHSPSTPDRYAYDFGMDIGSPLTAARGGTVVHIVESTRDGFQPNNLVVVDHGDGTFAQYMHLTFEGADVEIGDRVRPGDAIGRSGNTGSAGYPHLHFIVTRSGWAYPYQPVPVTFSNARPDHGIPQRGQTYSAGPF